VFYDLAYVGSTKLHVFDLSHPNIEAAVVSFSKPFGMFGDRIGFLFSRQPVQSLYANKWFKNLQGLVNADAVMRAIGPYELYERYRPMQEEIVLRLNQELGLPLVSSDALLLAHIKKAEGLSEEQQQLLQQFRRGPGYRVCLSRYFLERDAEYRDIQGAIMIRLGKIQI
jgi:aspartate/methionine/tyrosine aminotransferase